MSRLPDLADRIERLLLRHEEQKRTNILLEQQLRAVSDERDNLRSRLAAARARIDALIDRPPDTTRTSFARIDALIDRLPTSEGGHEAAPATDAGAEAGVPVEPTRSAQP